MNGIGHKSNGGILNHCEKNATRTRFGVYRFGEIAPHGAMMKEIRLG